MSASLIGRLGSSTFRLSTTQCRCRSRARASLRNRHQGRSIMGFEDEVERSFGRPCRQTNGRSKQTCELISSIVPRGTSFHRSVELEFSPLLVRSYFSPRSSARSLRITNAKVKSSQARDAVGHVTFSVVNCPAAGRDGVVPAQIISSATCYTPHYSAGEKVELAQAHTRHLDD